MKQRNLYLMLLTVATIAGAMYAKTTVIFLWWATVSGWLVWRGGW
ncbi:MAG TPA: hypothetical protein VFZ34_16525 [Blastocatellia bacterium]|nr:hypothetical protein [Blastocatellia bacterium]